MLAYLLSRMMLLIGAVAVVFAVEWLVVLTLGLESSAWTLLGTAVALALALRLWLGWEPVPRRGAAAKDAAGRWWVSHTGWADSHPLAAAVADGLAIVAFLSLWSLVFESPSDLTIAAAAACGALVFVFSAIVGLVDRRRARRQTEA